MAGAGVWSLELGAEGIGRGGSGGDYLGRERFGLARSTYTLRLKAANLDTWRDSDSTTVLGDEWWPGVLVWHAHVSVQVEFVPFFVTYLDCYFVCFNKGP
jgi:hypothetical protein